MEETSTSYKIKAGYGFNTQNSRFSLFGCGPSCDGVERTVKCNCGLLFHRQCLQKLLAKRVPATNVTIADGCKEVLKVVPGSSTPIVESLVEKCPHCL